MNETIYAIKDHFLSKFPLTKMLSTMKVVEHKWLLPRGSQGEYELDYPTCNEVHNTIDFLIKNILISNDYELFDKRIESAMGGIHIICNTKKSEREHNRWEMQYIPFNHTFYEEE